MQCNKGGAVWSEVVIILQFAPRQTRSDTLQISASAGPFSGLNMAQVLLELTVAPIR